MYRTLAAAIVGCALALGGGKALAVPVDCATVTTIGGWKAATDGCFQADKLWLFGSSDLDDSVQVLFSGATLSHVMQLVGFDTSDAADTWTINYTISVLDPANFFISDMFAGADNPGGGSLLTKTVTGDPGGAFVLTDTDGVEGPTAEKHGLTATSLSINEVFSVDAGADLNSVSNTYRERSREIPVPGSLALLGLGLIALGAVRRKQTPS